MLKLVQHNDLIYTLDLGLITVLIFRYRPEGQRAGYYYYEIGTFMTPEEDSALSKLILQTKGECLLKESEISRTTCPEVRAAEPPWAVVHKIERCMRELCAFTDRVTVDEWLITPSDYSQQYSLSIPSTGETWYDQNGLTFVMNPEVASMSIIFCAEADFSRRIWNFVPTYTGNTTSAKDILVDFIQTLVRKYREVSEC